LALWLVRPATDDQGPDLVQTVAAQLATAIDNASRYEEALRLAERDPLTGLLNHGGIHDRLAVEERRARQHGGCLSLVMIDLDDFKLLNDTYGHPAGDRVLARVSETIKGMLRHNDQAGRVGGDEMMLVLPDTDGEGAFRLAERLREKLSHEPFMAGTSRAIPLSLSFGVATYPTDADSLPRLIGAADASLYTSKLRGGDTISDASTKTEPQAEGHGLQALASRLMDVVGARDHYTRRHSDQVLVHALSLGETLGLSEDSLETLRLAACCTTWKIGVRARLLRKPAPPTDEEENAVRRHVDISETIIRDLPRVAEVLAVVHAHHERHDGEGYPVGLVGEDILCRKGIRPSRMRIPLVVVVDCTGQLTANGRRSNREGRRHPVTRNCPEVQTPCGQADSAYAATGRPWSPAPPPTPEQEPRHPPPG
jgi:diguanylate cyclase (GGDEF)-like protein